jgi:tetratricopeptide (TPR) repeat protein
MLLLGLLMPWPVVSLSLLAAAVLGYFLIPVITDLIIERREPRIMSADREGAQALIDKLNKSVLVTAFAPDAWVTLQRGRLFLALGDGRTAAQAFADTARVLGQADMPAMRSAQAAALMLADDRTRAREHLDALDQADALTARDRLYLGVVMLDEAARAAKAREHLEAAHEALDGHPQAAAALAVSLARVGTPAEVERAMELLEVAEAQADDDPIAQSLVKRARKALRPAKKKRKRKG